MRAGHPEFNGYPPASLARFSGELRLTSVHGYLRGRHCATLSSMGNQTYMKRQKELARQQKQKEKAARRVQRKAEKTKGGPPLETYNPLMPDNHPNS
jgi:hypothetical protein